MLAPFGSGTAMKPHCLMLWVALLTACSMPQPRSTAHPTPAEQPLDELPYTPSLDLAAMDRSVDPCVDFYAYSCGGWMRANPIPPDQAAWSVYGKLAEENRRFLWGALKEAAVPRPGRSAVEQKIGDYFAACMDVAAIDRAGLGPLRTSLDAIARLRSTRELPALVGREQLAFHSNLLFDWSAGQDFADATQVIGFAGAGGLGLPDRDYYVKTDAKSVEIRQRYRAHVGRMLELAGEPAATARRHADGILRLETALARASLTRVERRDPYKLYHKLTAAQLQALTPSFRWADYFAAHGLAAPATVNVTQPAFFRAVEAELASVDLDTWKAYLRWHLLRDRAPYLAAPFADEHFAFYRHYLRGVAAPPPRWKRCVAFVDEDLGEALGQVFVAKVFGPAVKARTLDMTRRIEQAMQDEIAALPWMTAATKQNALAKLHALANKIGYPDRWRDYSSVAIARDDFAGDVARAAVFESRRQLAKIGRPVDRGEWQMTPPTVNAYYDPQLNDMNFPAGILLPPLFDFKLDDAPNYGDTGSTIGHELTHAFDDEGRQYDAHGNLRDWWTPKDAAEFNRRAACVVDQYAHYTVVDDIKINSKLTLGEDVADLGGTVLAYAAWKRATAGKKLGPVDGFTPDQRFFIGLGQWACENQRPENLRLNAVTNPHSPGRYRINGVVSNLPEFARAFSCKPGQPMVRPKPCQVW